MLSFGQPVFALSSIRQMRGHTHAQLLSASDGYAYVTKYTSNPLGRRVLITEWIGAQLLRYVGLPAPVTVAVGTGRMSRGVPEGLHVGSRYPGDPSTTAVYDFLPDQLCKHVSDWRCLAAGVVTFDIWLANSDARQTIFARSAGELRPYFIDNTHLFGGPDWGFAMTPATGKLMPPSKLSGGLEWPDFCPWSARIQRLGDALLRIRDCAFG